MSADAQVKSLPTAIRTYFVVESIYNGGWAYEQTCFKDIDAIRAASAIAGVPVRVVWYGASSKPLVIFQRA